MLIKTHGTDMRINKQINGIEKNDYKMSLRIFKTFGYHIYFLFFYVCFLNHRSMRKGWSV